MSFLFCRLNSRANDLSFLWKARIPRRKFASAPWKYFVNIRYLTYMYNSTLASLPQNLLNFFFFKSGGYGQGEIGLTI